jgi:hypothetical protein
MTDILNGKTFYTGSENIKIRPVSLIEHSMDNWGTILLDFYRTGNRYSYTFGNLFPAALPASLVDQLKEDMIINTADNEAAMSARMHAIKAMYLNSLALGRGNSSDNLGVAFTQTYLYMVEMNKEIKNFVQYIQAGDFRSGFQFLVLNNTAVTDSISHYYNTACIDQQLLFTVLMITDAQAQPYTLNSSTKFVPVFIPHSAVLNLKTLSNAVVHTVNDLGNDFGSMYHNLDSMFNMSLDPNYLDFSNVKSPLDLILVLQRSNPNFLNITPYGITTFQDTRVTLRNAFSNYAENLNSADHFLDSLAVYRADFNLNGHGIKTVVSEINSFVQEVNTDFQQPDSTTLIHGVKVNLSAWFDNPPQNLLLKLKWFFDNDATTDNSLGGLFPGRNSTNNVQVYPQRPESYSMSQNFPNPFNPSTNITICLPSQSFVSLKVFDVIGREVETLMSQEKPAGTYTVTFDASKLPSGVYFYRLQARQTSGGQAGIFTETKKLILLR